MNATGGHGPIGYTVKKMIPSELIEFEFTQPTGFHGIHKFEYKALSQNKTEVKHTIDINTNFLGTLQWISFVRVLHDALIEDAFDKIENKYSNTQKKTDWSLYVKFLRTLLK